LLEALYCHHFNVAIDDYFYKGRLFFYFDIHLFASFYDLHNQLLAVIYI